MKKRRHLRTDGEPAYASFSERIGCVIALLIVTVIWIIGLIVMIRKIF